MRIENREAIEYLLKRDVSPLAADKHGRNALHYAVEFESLSSLIMLLEGAWISKEKFDFAYAIRASPWIINSWKALDQSVKDDGLLPFHIAALKGNSNILKYLTYITAEVRKAATEESFLDLDEMLEYKSKYSMTPLLLAVQYNKLESFQYLVMIGADIYAKSTRMQNFLHLAVINRNEDIIRWLVSKDSDKCILKWTKDYRGKRPSHYANKEEIKIALICMWESIRRRNLWEIYILMIRTKDKELLRIKHAQDGDTPLHYATKLGESEVVRLLVELEAPKDLVNSDGLTPMELSEKIENPDVKAKVKEALERDPADQIVLQTLKASQKMKKMAKFVLDAVRISEQPPKQIHIKLPDTQ